MHLPAPPSGDRSPEAFLRSCRSALAFAGLFSLFVGLLALVSPLYMMQIYDRVLSSRSEATLLGITLIVAFLLAVMALLEVLRSRVMVRMTGRLEAQAARPVLQGMFARALAGRRQLSAKVLRDFDQLRAFLGSNAVFAFFDAPLAPVFIAIVWMLHPSLGLLTLAGAVIIFALTIANELATRRSLGEANLQSARSSAVLDDSLRNAEALHAMGMFESLARRWFARRDATIGKQAVASDRAGIYLGATRFTRLLLQSLLLGGGAWLAVRQEITPGTIIAVSVLAQRGLAPVEQMVAGWKQFLSARQSYTSLKELFAELPPEAERVSLPAPKGNLVLDRLVVAPPGSETPSVKGVNLTLPAGQAVAVVGPSGAGKSSLARAAVGAWRPRAGTVRLDGAELQHWDPTELGPHIGYLPQDVELFEGTVAENVSRFGTIDSEKIVAAAKNAGVHDLILSLANGYETEIGPGGTVLSAGQRQRIGLARALYGDPRLIVLDEPNSNLDEAGEQALSAAIRSAKQGGAAVIVISHRKAVLDAVDNVVAMADGQVQWAGERGANVVRTHPAASQPAARIQAAQ